MKALILAAGKGTRLQSEAAQIPKAMRLVNGKPILSYILDTLGFIKKEDIYIVVGFLKEKITRAFPEYKFVVQEQLLGTGSAVMCAEKAIGDKSGDIMVLLGDMPLLERDSLNKLIEVHNSESNVCTVLSCEIDGEKQLGRIKRENQKFCGIVEDKDCTDEERKITEYNTGVMIFNAEILFRELRNIKNNNKNNEYRITDMPEILLAKGRNVGIYKSPNAYEICGVNSLEDISEIESVLKRLGR